MRPEQIRALAYLRRRGTEAPVEEVRARVAATYGAVEALVDAVPAAIAREHRSTSGWCIQEVADHLLESDRPALGQLARLLAGESVDAPIPASLQSAQPHDRDWSELRAELRAVHRELLDLLERAHDGIPQSATGAVQMVVPCARADGSLEPVSWVERLDWKAFALVLHAHNRQHIDQIERILAAPSDGSGG